MAWSRGILWKASRRAQKERADGRRRPGPAVAAQPDAAAEELTPLLGAYRRRHPKASVELIIRAYERARDAHPNQMRMSGETYINHPLAVAHIVADIGLDDTTLAAALLHDAVEDTEVSLVDVERQFGAEIAAIVDGVTKLDRLRFDSKEEQQAATMRKMLVAMAKDLRVLIIKLADRLHNMRTLAALPAEKQARIAQETLDIYAPLAHRLGMAELKQQLEDLSFALAAPEALRRDRPHGVDCGRPSATCTWRRCWPRCAAACPSSHIDADVTGRPKHLWSIYEKMVVKGKEFDEIFDLVAIRVIVDSVKDCYAALGSIHGTWKPVRGPVQGLHRHAEVQPLPVAAHHGDRAGGQAARGADPHPRDAPAGRVGCRGALVVQGGLALRRHRLAQPHHRLAEGDIRTRPSSWRP